MNPENEKLMQELNNVKYQMKVGIISYDEAKEKAEPLLEELNKRMAEISKKHGMRPRKVTFTSFMR